MFLCFSLHKNVTLIPINKIFWKKWWKQQKFVFRITFYRIHPEVIWQIWCVFIFEGAEWIGVQKLTLLFLTAEDDYPSFSYFLVILNSEFDQQFSAVWLWFWYHVITDNLLLDRSSEFWDETISLQQIKPNLGPNTTGPLTLILNPNTTFCYIKS